MITHPRFFGQSDTPGFGFSNDNDNAALVPEWWSREGLLALSENIVAPFLFWTDFPGADKVAKFGEVVTVPRPEPRKAKRKTGKENLQTDPTILGDVEFRMNQHFYDTFCLSDEELTVGYDTLFNTHLQPSMDGIARSVERASVAQMFQFAHQVGQLGSGLNRSTVLAARKKLNQLLCPMDRRNFLLTCDAETDALGIEQYVENRMIADGGAALREATLGRRDQFNMVLALLQPSVTAALETQNTATTADAAVGATTLEVDATAGMTAGQFIVVDGDRQVNRIATVVDADTITVVNPLRTAVASGAAVAAIGVGAVNQPSIAAADGGTGAVNGYRKAWHKAIAYDGAGALVPEIGQLVSFGTAVNSPVYTIIEIDSDGLWLDRPLDEAVAEDAALNFGPAGQYNFAFRKEAIGFLTRPLRKVIPNTGAVSHVSRYKGLSLRSTISYDSLAQSHRVTLDLLGGFNVMYPEYGVVALS